MYYSIYSTCDFRVPDPSWVAIYNSPNKKNNYKKFRIPPNPIEKAFLAPHHIGVTSTIRISIFKRENKLANFWLGHL